MRSHKQLYARVKPSDAIWGSIRCDTRNIPREDLVKVETAVKYFIAFSIFTVEDDSGFFPSFHVQRTNSLMERAWKDAEESLARPSRMPDKPIGAKYSRRVSNFIHTVYYCHHSFANLTLS
jgi:hypothetical protein